MQENFQEVPKNLIESKLAILQDNTINRFDGIEGCYKTAEFIGSLGNKNTNKVCLCFEKVFGKKLNVV